MAKIPSAIRERAIQVGFVDPISGLPPREEVMLSALLTIYHQGGRIRWGDVPLRLSSGEDANATASTIFDRPGYLCSEYPLFWKTPEECEARGGIRPDLLYLSSDGDRVVFVENKVGAPHKVDKYGGQFGRYIKYLLDCKVPAGVVILLTGQAFIDKRPPWYLPELVAARGLQCPSGGIETYVMTWEAVFAAFDSSNKPLQRPGSAGR